MDIAFKTGENWSNRRCSTLMIEFELEPGKQCSGTSEDSTICRLETNWKLSKILYHILQGVIIISDDGHDMSLLNKV